MVFDLLKSLLAWLIARLLGGARIGPDLETGTVLDHETAGQVVKSLKDHGFAWLKTSHQEKHCFQTFQDHLEGNLDQGGAKIGSKTLLRHTGNRNPRVPHALYEAADKASFT